MGLEGGLRIGLRVSAGRVGHVRITSTRPDLARKLLQGRSRAELSATVPLLFSICGRSQAVASGLACAAATGEAVTAEQLARASAAVSAETVREATWRMLLDWPKAIGEPPDDAAVAAARGSLALQSGASDEATAIAIAAFGASAEEWLALPSLAELDRWTDQGHTAAARFIRHVRDDVAAAEHTRAGTINEAMLLDGRPHLAWIAELAQAMDADADFSRQPVWRGAPAETGALARLQSDALLGALMRRSASRIPARLVARLRELALLLAGRATAQVGAMAVPSGGGIAWVENARGLLIHRLRLDQGRSVDYRIVAPTEWNFHPAGAVALALANAPANDIDATRYRTTLLVNSLDPCVACHVEFDDA